MRRCVRARGCFAFAFAARLPVKCNARQHGLPAHFFSFF